MAATKREWYILGDTSGIEIYDTVQYGQTFTIGTTGVNEDFNITSIKMKGYKGGNPDILFADIKAVDGEGKPTGAVLSAGQIDPSGWGGSPGTFHEILMSAYILLASTQYALILRSPDSPDTLNCPFWRYEWNSPTYEGGVLAIGLPWALYPTGEFVFEIWGESGGEEAKKSIGNLSARPDKEIVAVL